MNPKFGAMVTETELAARKANFWENHACSLEILSVNVLLQYLVEMSSKSLGKGILSGGKYLD